MENYQIIKVSLGSTKKPVELVAKSLKSDLPPTSSATRQKIPKIIPFPGKQNQDFNTVMKMIQLCNQLIGT